MADAQLTTDDPKLPLLRPLFAWSAIVVLIILAVVRSYVATRTDGFTVDEAYHITAGVSYVKLRDFRLNPEHPPLVKLWVGAALAPDFQLPLLPQLSDKFAERQFNESVVFLQNDPDRVQARVRAAMFSLNALLLLFLAFAISRTLGNAAAVGAIAFLAIDPTVSAHLPVVLTDLPVALLAATSILFALRAFCTARWLDVSLAALALGLTLGAKHSGLIAFVAVALGGTAVALFPGVVSTTTNRARILIVSLTILIGSVVLLWGLYGFRYAETPSGAEAFNRPLAFKLDELHSQVARPAVRATERFHLLPRAYIWGLSDTIRTGMQGRGIPVYFLEKTYIDRGPIYFFPVVLAAKLPLGLLGLGLAGLLLPTRLLPHSWRLPSVALLLLAVAFLLALARGVSYGGVRHALPVLVVLSVFGGMASALGLLSNSRLARVLVAASLVLAALSALPRVRPWEYFNEAAGGPARACLHFGDEGVDMGQRTLDFARYYRERLEPSGELPYLLYPMSTSEQRRRGVRTRASVETEEVEQSVDVSGVFFVTAMVIFQPEYQAFRDATPNERIGNLLIYRGSFHLPWLRETKLLLRARRLLAAPQPDLAKAEVQLREVLTINPKNLGALLHLGNLKLRQGERNEAVQSYAQARDQMTDDLAMRALLEQQIVRLTSGEAIERIPPVRDPREE
ncbi:MAG TPA: tetratricopeptide repeat protein [Pyrinomonadaceae bacterium]|nr:tetratricopeptide repeat protein [Pyrinomonadaceae bacterium]